MRSPADNVPDLLDRLEWLDDPAGAAQEKIKQAVPRSSPAGEALSGTWLGHPLHPLLTDVVLGSWTSSARARSRRRPQGPARCGQARCRRRPLGLPRRRGRRLRLGRRIRPGKADGRSPRSRKRGRSGAVHRLAHRAPPGMQKARSRLVPPRSGRRGDGRLAREPPNVLARRRRQRGGLRVAAGRVDPIRGDAPAEGTMRRALASNVQVLLVTYEGKTRALLDRCSHRGCSLAEGTLEAGHVVCGCHGSTFALDGSVRRGPAFAPQPTLDVRRHDGRLEVRSAR